MALPPPSFAEFCHNQCRDKGIDPDQLDLDQARADYAGQYSLKVAVYVDDERLPTQRIDGFANWVVCRNGHEWAEYLAHHGPPHFVSFDHDLAEEHYLDWMKYELKEIPAIEYESFKEPTGFDCARLYAEFCEFNGLEMGQVATHCVERPMGAYNIEHLLDSYLESKGSPIRCFRQAIPCSTPTERAAANGLVLGN